MNIENETKQAMVDYLVSLLNEEQKELILKWLNVKDDKLTKDGIHVSISVLFGRRG